MENFIFCAVVDDVDEGNVNIKNLLKLLKKTSKIPQSTKVYLKKELTET